MALNQMIAQGAQFNMPDPVAQYAKMQQLQAIQSQNSLAQYQLGSAQRGDMQQNALYARLQDPNFDQANPQHLASLSQFGTPGIQAMKAITEASNARQTGQKLEGENRGAQQKEIDQIARNLSQHPDDDSIRASMDIIQKSSFYSPEAKAKAVAAFERALQIPLTERGSYFGMQGATAGDVARANRPIAVGGSLMSPTGQTIASAPEPGFTLRQGETRYPAGYKGVASAPAATPAPAAVPPSVAEYQFAKTSDGGNFVGTYQEFVKAKADAARGPAPVAAPQALPASVQEYEYAKTVPGGNFVGTYQDFVKAKADAARGPAPVAAPQAQPASVLEYNFAKTPDGGSFVGTYQDFVQAKAEAARAPAPVAAPPSMVAEYTFAKTPEGGNFKGTYQQFVTARAVAGRAPPAPRAEPAPTLDTIVDPNNPNQMLRIDVRRYSPGGSVGSPGVIGVSGKEPGAALRQNKVEAGKTQLADDLENLRASFLVLDKIRAIPSTERNPLSNLASFTAASGVGQIAGRAFSTEAQVEREVINSARTRLVNSIKNATGMSAQQLNSNVELQTMLKSISDPAQPVQAALRIIEDIENAYVKGEGMPKKNAPGGGAPAAAATGNVVVTPDGRSHTFPTPAAAAQFKKAAGL